LGIGPSAHSYNGESRQWNAKINLHYVESIEKGISTYSIEKLDIYSRMNDYILTRLRTMWGIDLNEISHQFGPDFAQTIQKNAMPYLQNNHLDVQNNVITLTHNGKMVADRIASDLFVLPE